MMKSYKRFLQLCYRDTYEKCAGYSDDRLLFRNSYDLLMDAVNEMVRLGAQNPVVRIAFYKEFRLRLEELKRLEESLIERKMLE